MKRAVWGLVWVAAVCSFAPKVRADADYYEAIKRAESAASAGDFTAAARVILTALRKYPRDYTLTLKLGWIEFQLTDYVAAERTYREASALSDGEDVDATLGLGWALVQQDRCEVGVPILQRILAQYPDESAAQRGIHACEERHRVHGSVWLSLGGSLYQHDPWKRSAENASVGLSLQPYRTLSLGGAYRFLALQTADRRVAGFNQHEVYLQAGYTSPTFDLLAHGALIWGGDAIANGSMHGGVSTRLRMMRDFLDELLAEFSASHYTDLWVMRLDVGWRIALGMLSVTPGVAIEKLARESLLDGSVTVALALGAITLWLSGKYGPEYRAAYLSQFAISNSLDRGIWSASAGLRHTADEHWSFFASYTLIRMRSPDDLLSALHILSIGAVYVL